LPTRIRSYRSIGPPPRRNAELLSVSCRQG